MQMRRCCLRLNETGFDYGITSTDNRFVAGIQKGCSRHAWTMNEDFAAV
jgi:hypothetical protein